MTPKAEIANPFDADVVAFPGQPVPIDVREIHELAFRQCQEEYGKVGAQSRSMLLHGRAGCGKTHLLGRFRRWLAGEIDGGPAVRPAAFVAVRMETAPGQVWRHLQRRFAEQLLERPAGGPAALDGILDGFARRHPSRDVGAAFEELDIRDLSLELVRVLESYADGRHRKLCRAWLKGEALTARDQDALELPARLDDEADDESGESGARRFVLSLTRICAPLPVVFCFDQIEALSLSSAANSYGPFAKMCACLIDETPNSMVVSSVLTTFLPDFERQSMASDLDRIRKVVVDLHPLDYGLGTKLIEARLDAVEALRPYRPRGGVDPLPAEALRRVFAANHGRCTARKLIHEARRLFDHWRGQEPPAAVPLPDFLSRRFARYWESSPVRDDPGCTDEILAHGLARIAGLAGGRIAVSMRPGIDFEAETPAGPVFICLCSHTSTTGLAKRLKHIRANLDAEAKARLCLVRDARVPISPKATVSRQTLADLQSAGARLIRPQTEALAALDAMRRLLAESASGDLTHQGESVAPETVRDWLSANLPGAVRSLLDEIGGAPAAAQRDDALLEILREAKIMAARDAARQLGWMLEQIEEHARQNPDSLGFVAGPCPVVYHVGFPPSGGSDHDV